MMDSYAARTRVDLWALFGDLPTTQDVWMSHGDSIVAAPPGLADIVRDHRGVRVGMHFFRFARPHGDLHQPEHFQHDDRLQHVDDLRHGHLAARVEHHHEQFAHSGSPPDQWTART